MAIKYLKSFGLILLIAVTAFSLYLNSFLMAKIGEYEAAWHRLPAQSFPNHAIERRNETKRGIIQEDGLETTDRSSSGYVPDEKTAIQIALAVWTPIYGEEKIESEKPYYAKLVGNKWIVRGSLPKRFTYGGTAIAEISKDDGRILRVTHGK